MHSSRVSTPLLCLLGANQVTQPFNLNLSQEAFTKVQRVYTQTEKANTGSLLRKYFQAKYTWAKRLKKKTTPDFQTNPYENKTTLSYAVLTLQGTVLQQLQHQGCHPCQELGSSRAGCICLFLNYMSQHTIRKYFQSELKEWDGL